MGPAHSLGHTEGCRAQMSCSHPCHSLWRSRENRSYRATAPSPNSILETQRFFSLNFEQYKVSWEKTRWRPAEAQKSRINLASKLER